MSSRSSAPENDASNTVNAVQGQQKSRDGDERDKSFPPSQDGPARSNSLLSQAFAPEPDQTKTLTSHNTFGDNPEASTAGHQQHSVARDGVRCNGLTLPQQPPKTMAVTDQERSSTSTATTVPLPTAGREGVNGSAVPPTTARFNHVRGASNGSRGRGTSLERTEKERKARESVKDAYSINPGDIGMSSPKTPKNSASEPLANTPSIDGIRARYRQWREPPPTSSTFCDTSAGRDNDQGGEIEQSIAEAMAGGEPNNRSRKASHSMRFFREGLPDDRSKKWDFKQRRRTETSSSGKSSQASEMSKQDRGRNDRENGALVHKKIHPSDDRSISHPRRQDTKQEQKMAALNPSESTIEPDNHDYFDKSHATEPNFERNKMALPAQLLEDIRSHHNLTPGAGKGSSFSRSIPVTASERHIPPEEEEQKHKQAGYDQGDGAQTRQRKVRDDEEESGEEQMTSALFVPHHAPDGRSRDNEAIKRYSRDKSSTELSATEQWLERTDVPSHDLELVVSDKDTELRTLTSNEARRLGAIVDLESVEAQEVSEGGYTTKGEESSQTDDPESTPTGSVRAKHDLAMRYKKHIHNHQQEPKAPLAAIELMPYSHQVGGHTTMWRFTKRAVCKQMNNSENAFYEKVERYHPNLMKFLPR